MGKREVALEEHLKNMPKMNGVAKDADNPIDAK